MATKWLTVAQASRRLGVSESTVWRLLRRGRLTSARLGGRRRIAATALGQALRFSGPVGAPRAIPPLTLEDSLITLAGRFRSDGSAPGASDKHAYLGTRV